MVDRVMALGEGARIQVLAPVVRGRKGEYKKLFEEIRRDGFVRVRVDGELRDVSEEIELDKNKKHDIAIVVDRIVVREGVEGRLADSIETALQRAEGIVLIDVVGGEDMLFSEKFACVDCGVSFEELSPRMFSFNSPYGACPTCDGLGHKMEIDPELVLDQRRSLMDGGIIPWADSHSRWLEGVLSGVCRKYGIDPDQAHRRADAQAAGDPAPRDGRRSTSRFEYTNSPGADPHFPHALMRGSSPTWSGKYREAQSDWARSEVEQYMSTRPCPDCSGRRLRPESLAVKVGGLNIMELTSLSVRRALQFFEELELTEREELIARQVLKEIKARLGFLVNVGLDYLTLERAAGTLSGGEAQRIRLATQIGSSLVGVLYILDEPSIGLHQRDNRRLLDTLKGLRDLGNTLIVVEHDEETIREADFIVDIGPGAGANGGRVVAAGTVEEVMQVAGVGHGPVFEREAGASACPPAARAQRPVDRGERRPGEQPERDRRRLSDGRLRLRDRRLGLGKEHPGQRDPAQPPPPRAAPGPRPGRRPRRHRRDRAPGKGDRHRPVADRADAPLQPGDVHGRLRQHPGALCPDPRGQDARVQAGALLASTSRAAGARRARATGSSRSRCTSSPTCTSRARCARASGTTGRRWRSATRARASPTCWR